MQRRRGSLYGGRSRRRGGRGKRLRCGSKGLGRCGLRGGRLGGDHGLRQRENRQFQLNTLVGAAAHLVQRRAERIDSAHGLGLRGFAAGGVGGFLLRRNAREQCRAALQRAEHQIAVVPGQFHAEPTHIHAFLAQLGDFFQRGHGVLRGDGVADVKQIAAVGHARHAAHQRFVHGVVHTGAGVQDGKRIAHRAVCQTSDEPGSGGVKVDVLLPGDIGQAGGDILGGDAGKIVPLAAA